MKKPTNFPQGSQRIARITELSEPNTYVLEPAPELPEQDAAAVEALAANPLSDAELASAFVDGDAPIAVRRARRVTSAYAASASSPAGPVPARKIITLA